MIRVTANKGMVDIHEASGTGIQIMTELCCIVAAVCQGLTDDEENSKEMKSIMIKEVARALIAGEDKLDGKKVD